MKFKVWKPDREDDDSAVIIEACDAEAAAIAWAELDDWGSAEYRIASGDEAEVIVHDELGVLADQTFCVVGEARPQYSARKK